MAKLQLVSPWINFYHEVNAFFRYDRDVTVIFDEEETEVKLYVNGNEKAEALSELLPDIRKFGNVTLRVAVILTNDNPASCYYKPRTNQRTRGGYSSSSMTEMESQFTMALRGNPIFSFTDGVDLQTNRIIYVVFRNEVVQYYNDDLGDYYGQCSTLYQTIAADIFKPIDGVHYCTDKPQYDDRYDI